MKVNQRDTKTRILDSAERLFAGKGFHNTSLRDITKDAEVNLAAVNYHFGTKDALFEEVFKRHFLPVNRIRLSRLEEIRDRAARDRSRPSAREILQAFIAPVIHFRKTEPGAAAFITLVIRTMSEHDDRLRQILMGYFRPTFLLCLDILREALPRIPADVLFWRLQFCIGTMSHTLHMMDQSRMFPDGVVPVYDVDSMTSMIVSFVTAGMETQ
jgi:AcrR family transcriptional regulator